MGCCVLLPPTPRSVLGLGGSSVEKRRDAAPPYAMSPFTQESLHTLVLGYTFKKIQITTCSPSWPYFWPVLSWTTWMRSQAWSKISSWSKEERMENKQPWKKATECSLNTKCGFLQSKINTINANPVLQQHERGNKDNPKQARRSDSQLVQIRTMAICTRWDPL